MINHKALAILREMAIYIDYFRFSKTLQILNLKGYVMFMKDNKLGIDTDNVDMIDQEPVKE